MGWRFRRSLRLGPLRLNFSKSGIGYSAGVRGFHIGKDARGSAYTAVSIPGTGIYNRQHASAAKPLHQPVNKRKRTRACYELGLSNLNKLASMSQAKAR